MNQLSTSDWLLQLLDHKNFLAAAGMLLGAIAILTVATIVIVVAKLALSHRQRMAMIARGMHPDAILTEMVDEPPPSASLPGHAPGPDRQNGGA
jgi:hypothetical protein